jgi:hypothetical protein
MVDYGFRVSHNDVDVKTGDDEEMVVTSKYSELKGTLSGSGSKAIPHNTVQTVTIAHGLGYIPFVNAYVDVAQDGNFATMPIFLASLIDQQTYWVKADDTNVYLKFWQGNDFSDTYTVDYKYFIFIDKGKL